MKKIVTINSSSFYSTGTIVNNIASKLSGYYDFYHASADHKDEKTFQVTKNYPIRQLGKVYDQLFDKDGFSYNSQTKKLINWIDSLHVDLIHIHNAHGYYLNLEHVLLYAYKNNIPVVYTMHDCWTFTGRCAYFTGNGCDKWKSGCGDCKFKSSYPKTRLCDDSKNNWERKKRLLTNHNITFVSPSNWLRNFASESFLANEKLMVINNGIDTGLFSKEVTGYELTKGIDPNKKMILSVAFPFTKEKGLEDINQLQDLIDKDEYQIVLVGITDEYKTKEDIIRVAPTKDKNFLAFMYQHAYCFAFFTHQDNYPTVLLESLACGTPIVAFDVGGVPEIVQNNKTGYTVELGNISDAYEKIKEIGKIDRSSCKKIGSEHSIDNFAEQYRLLYKSILGE